MTDKEALHTLKHGLEVDQKTLRRLAQHDLINVQDVTDHDTPPSLKKYIFLSLTMKGQDSLESPGTKLESAPGYPTEVMYNGITTKFVRNVTPDRVYQIAEVIGAGDYLLLFSGDRDDGEEFLHRKIEEEYPGLMNPPFLRERVARSTHRLNSRGCPVQASLGRGCSSVTDHHPLREQTHGVPWSLKHFQQSGRLHYLTFSCYHRQAKLGTPAPRDLFVRALETVRHKYGLLVYGFVVMPEHVHLLVSEPEKGRLAQALQSLKQSVARRLALRATEPFWQARYYDFNVWSESKFTEKLRYIHRNPVTRGLVDRPEDWSWSSFRHYLTGEICGVEIESQWIARARERLGVFPTVRVSKKTPAQAELGRGTLESRVDG